MRFLATRPTVTEAAKAFQSHRRVSNRQVAHIKIARFLPKTTRFFAKYARFTRILRGRISTKSRNFQKIALKCQRDGAKKIHRAAAGCRWGSGRI
ncbi:hypothetical protein GGD83_001279 [Rhodoblastus sphagnicola]|uniref:hypothetical protein n=1 Tax=Rhodoblastus sphagnicola TaxID=333368 RepID=UPI0011B066E0|nr:hypothetical protein [Rhodoblastus sphagnicola]MBB4197493.1 hypothetical protein [Rhodoblastus sphagnicola]